MQYSAMQMYPTMTAGLWPRPMAEPQLMSIPASPSPAPVEPNPGTGTRPEDDAAFLQLLYGEITKRLMPAVADVLERHESDGGAVYDDQIDRETLARLVDEILDEAAAYSADIEELSLNTAAHHERWGCYRLLRALAEALALQHIQLRRHQCRRRNRNMVDIVI